MFTGRQDVVVEFLPLPDHHWLRFVVGGAQPTAQPKAKEESVWNAALDAKLQEALEQVPAGTYDRWVKITSIVRPKSATQYTGHTQATARSKAAQEFAAKRIKAPEERRQKDDETDKDARTQCDHALEAVLEQAASLSVLCEKVVNGASTSTDDINCDMYTILAPKHKIKHDPKAEVTLTSWMTMALKKNLRMKVPLVSGSTRAAWRSSVRQRVKCQRRYWECLGT